MCVRMHLITSHVSATGLWFVPFKQMDYIYIYIISCYVIRNYTRYAPTNINDFWKVGGYDEAYFVNWSVKCRYPCVWKLKSYLASFIETCALCQKYSYSLGNCLQFKSVSVLIATNTALNKVLFKVHSYVTTLAINMNTNIHVYHCLNPW